jgi:acyl homoserine lactone synthase
MQSLSGKFAVESPDFERALAAYRYEVFVERLKWDLQTPDALERDQFDRPDTVYVATRDDEGAIIGCARLLPTVKPYLLAEVFPELLNGAPAPCSADVWELSRFAAVDLKSPSSVSQGRMSAEGTFELLDAAMKCAASYGAKRLITTSPLGIERLLRRMGVNAHRAGPPMVVHGHPLFACWIEIEENWNQAPSGSTSMTVN